MSLPSILIIPAVSAGNIPQLTVDLLIHTLGAKFIKSLDDKYLYPFAGPRDTPEGVLVDNNSLTTPIEVYSTETGIVGGSRGHNLGRLTLIQLRSPTLPGFKTKFVIETLIPFINENRFTDVVVLGSSNAAFEHSNGEGGRSGANRLRIFTTDERSSNTSNVGEGDLCQRLAALTLGSNSKQLPGPPKSLPESGIVLNILNQADDHITKPTSVSAIVTFAYEGDNFGDAEWFADEVVRMLNIKKQQQSHWIHPRSWEGAYGKAIPIGVEEGLYS